MKIMTFGSCFSRMVVDALLRLEHHDYISAIYNNRTDAFLANVVKGSAEWLPDYDEVLNNMRYDPLHRKGHLEVLLNQYPERGMGQHKTLIKRGNLFSTTVEQQADAIDLIIMDNYADLTARLATYKPDPSKQLLLDFKKITNFDDYFEMSDEFISVEESVANFIQLFDFFTTTFPKAQVFFTHFAMQHYDDEKRVQRALQFESLMAQAKQTDRLHILPSLPVTDHYIAEQKQHHQLAYYNYLAGYIKLFLSTHAVRTPVSLQQGEPCLVH